MIKAPTKLNKLFNDIFLPGQNRVLTSEMTQQLYQDRLWYHPKNGI